MAPGPGAWSPGRGALCGKTYSTLPGVTTLAESQKLNQDTPSLPPGANPDRRLEQAGGGAGGALNMDEYAYGFVTIQ